MYQILSRSPSHIEIKATGKLTREDYAQLIPLLEEQHAGAPETNYLLILDAFEGWEPEAFWQDLKFDHRHRDDFARAAIVGEERWEALAVRLSKAVFPGEIRFFPAHQLISARDWIRQGRHAGATRES